MNKKYYFFFFFFVFLMLFVFIIKINSTYAVTGDFYLSDEENVGFNRTLCPILDNQTDTTEFIETQMSYGNLSNWGLWAYNNDTFYNRKTCYKISGGVTSYIQCWNHAQNYWSERDYNYTIEYWFLAETALDDTSKYNLCIFYRTSSGTEVSTAFSIKLTKLRVSYHNNYGSEIYAYENATAENVQTGTWYRFSLNIQTFPENSYIYLNMLMFKNNILIGRIETLYGTGWNNVKLNCFRFINNWYSTPIWYIDSINIVNIGIPIYNLSNNIECVKKEYYCINYSEYINFTKTYSYIFAGNVDCKANLSNYKLNFYNYYVKKFEEFTEYTEKILNAYYNNSKMLYECYVNLTYNYNAIKLDFNITLVYIIYAFNINSELKEQNEYIKIGLILLSIFFYTALSVYIVKFKNLLLHIIMMLGSIFIFIISFGASFLEIIGILLSLFNVTINSLGIYTVTRISRLKEE